MLVGSANSDGDDDGRESIGVSLFMNTIRLGGLKTTLILRQGASSGWWRCFNSNSDDDDLDSGGDCFNANSDDDDLDGGGDCFNANSDGGGGDEVSHL